MNGVVSIESLVLESLKRGDHDLFAGGYLVLNDDVNRGMHLAVGQRYTMPTMVVGDHVDAVRLVLPPSTVNQAARSSFLIAPAGNRPGTTQLITPIPTNSTPISKDG